MSVRLDHGDDDLAEVHEINVTPFIDVMLVLLIIFMIAAPLATVDIPINMASSNAQQQQRPLKPVYLTIKSDLSLIIGDGQPVARSALGPAVEQALQGDKQNPLMLRADKDVPYGELMALMNDLRTAGILKFSLVALDIAGQPAK